MKFKFFLLTIIFLIFPISVLAQERIDNFDVVITPQKDGLMKIEESIKYDFGPTSKHGIFRTIPLVSSVGDLYRVIKVDFNSVSRDGNPEKYSIDKSSSETEIKIGDPNKTISGPHNYSIKYTVSNGIGSNFDDHDEIYWNITGNEWPAPIDRVTAVIKTDFPVKISDTICYTGRAGSLESNCKIEDIEGGKKITASGLFAYEGLTIVSSFPVNTFPKSILQKNAPTFDPDFLTFLKFYLPIIGILNLTVAPYLLFWYFKNKHKNRFGPPAVNFDIPKDNQKQIITPLEAGIIDNTKLEKNDVIATTFDLAIRKYIKIEEVKKKRTLLPDETDYQIIKLKDYSDVNAVEKKLLDRYFEAGNEVLLEDLKIDFYDTFQDMEDEGFCLLKQRGFYSKNPKSQMAGLLVLSIFALVSLNLLIAPVLFFLSRKLNGRTQLGDEIDWKVDGLKIFLKGMSRYHGWQAKNLITVERYIPYAIALGLHDQFMEQLKIVTPNYKSSWYSGSTNSFYNSYGGFYSSMGSNITTHAPSSSSGFSGGSSGGGGGGGGGGSW